MKASPHRMKWFSFCVQGVAVFLCAAVLHAGVVGAQIKVHKNLTPYQKSGNFSGTLSSIGSDTLNNLMTQWGEAFRRHHPSVKVQIEGKGSSTAPPALIDQTAQLGPMSRKIKSREAESFEKRYGYPPTALAVAIDALAVYVHKDNPIQGLTLPQVDAIFSSTRKGGYPDPINRWREIAVNTRLGAQRISVYGRNSASGTYGYFKQIALFKGDFRSTVKEQPGSSSVVNGVAKDLAGIGYSGIGYRTSDVRAVPLSKKGKVFYLPTQADSLRGKYPLARLLYVYLNKAPHKPLDPLTREFMVFVLSRQGQRIVAKDGYYPLPPHIQKKQFGALR